MKPYVNYNNNNNRREFHTLFTSSRSPMNVEGLYITNKRTSTSTKDNNYKLSLNNSSDSINENPNEVVSQILDTMTQNSLNVFYDSNSDFKNKIDSLNLKFYLETEKYLTNQQKKINCQTSLFIILFKQINIYIEEIKRLNLILITKKYEPQNIKKRTDELTQKQKEFETKEEIIKALKVSQSNMEKKLLEAMINENNLKKKIEYLQKEIDIYRNKIIKANSNSITQTIKVGSMSSSFQITGKHPILEEINKSNVKNEIMIFDKHNITANSENDFVNLTNTKTNNSISISINSKNKLFKSKSPPNIIKDSNFKLKKIANKNNLNYKRNHSQNNKFNKFTENIQFKNNKSKYVINKDVIKHNNTGDLNENNNISNNELIVSKQVKKISKINKNLIKDTYKKILIGNKKAVIKEESSIHNSNNNSQCCNRKFINDLFITNISNNSYSGIKPVKQKVIISDLDSINKGLTNNNFININNMISSINTSNETTIIKTNNNSIEDNAFSTYNCFRINKRNKTDTNDNNKNINNIINKSIINDIKCKSLMNNKDKNKNKDIRNNRNKNIIMISNSLGIGNNNKNSNNNNSNVNHMGNNSNNKKKKISIA